MSNAQLETFRFGTREDGTLAADFTTEWLRVPTDVEAVLFHIFVDDGAGGSHSAAGNIIIQGTNSIDEIDTTGNLPVDVYFEDPSALGTTSTTYAVSAGTDVSQDFKVLAGWAFLRVFFDRTAGDANDQIRIYANFVH